MKLIILVISVFILAGCNTSGTDTNKFEVDTSLSIEELEKKGFEIYQESPEEAIAIFEVVAEKYEKNGDYKKEGITKLNIANIYDERMEDMDSALRYAEKSLDIWVEHKDTMQIANLYKYIGLLKGKTERFEEAEEDIGKAMRMYTELGFDQGVAVSQINLAEALLRQDKWREAEALFLKSKPFWMEQGDQGRVFTNNILGIQIYEAAEDEARMQALIEENNGIIEEYGMDEYNVGRFESMVEGVGSREP